MSDLLDRLFRVLTDPVAHPWLHAVFVMLGSSVGGLCAALKEGKTLNARQVAYAVLNSGFMGLIVFLVTYSRLRDDMQFLVGISLLAGIGSASLATFMLELLKRFLAAFFGLASAPSCPTPPSKGKSDD